MIVEGGSFPIMANTNSIDPKNIEVIDISQKYYDLWRSPSNSDLFSSLPDYSMHIPSNHKIKEMAENVSRIISDEYTCIHVRRGDRVFDLKTSEIKDEELNQATQPKKHFKIFKTMRKQKSLHYER